MLKAKKAPHLTPEIRTVTRAGKTFQMTVWVDNRDKKAVKRAKGEAPGQLLLFDLKNEPAKKKTPETIPYESWVQAYKAGAGIEEGEKKYLYDGKKKTEVFVSPEPVKVEPKKKTPEPANNHEKLKRDIYNLAVEKTKLDKDLRAWVDIENERNYLKAQVEITDKEIKKLKTEGKGLTGNEALSNKSQIESLENWNSKHNKRIEETKNIPQKIADGEKRASEIDVQGRSLSAEAEKLEEAEEAEYEARKAKLQDTVEWMVERNEAIVAEHTKLMEKHDKPGMQNFEKDKIRKTLIALVDEHNVNRGKISDQLNIEETKLTGQPKETSHAGLRLYREVAINKEGEKQVRWYVETKENAGTDKSTGNSIYDTLQEAKQGAEIDQRNSAQREEYDKEQKIESDKKAAEARARKEKNKGLSITQIRANAYLEKNLPRPIYNGKTAEQHLAQEGMTLEAVETDSMDKWNRRKAHRMNQQEQDEYEKRLSKPRTSYRMSSGKDSYYEIPATLYKYLAKQNPDKIKGAGKETSEAELEKEYQTKKARRDSIENEIGKIRRRMNDELSKNSYGETNRINADRYKVQDINKQMDEYTEKLGEATRAFSQEELSRYVRESE